MATSLAALLRTWRERAMLSQEQLAARAGVGVRTVRRLETEGTRRPHGDSLRLLADALTLSEPERAELAAAIQMQPAAALAVPRQLPAAVRQFVGRATEIKQLTEVLSESAGPGSAPLVVAITGTAGVGKTALALHWGHQVADRFPDGLLYTNLRGFDPGGQVMDPSVAMRGFLDSFDMPPQRIPADPDAQAALYRSTLSGRRALVVLDNARDSGQVRPLLPGSGGSLVVVTSRNQLTGLGAGGAFALNLDLLSTMEAREFLSRRLGPERVAAEQEAVDDIIARCARLPLALAIVAAHADANPQLGLNALAAQLCDAAEQLDVLTGDDPATDVRAVFSWSCQALDPAVAHLFRLLGLHPGAEFGASAAASLAGIPLGRTRSLLAALARASLLVAQPAGRFAQHDLLKAYAAEQAVTYLCDDEQSAAVQRILDHYLHTAFHATQLAAPRDHPFTLAQPAAGVTPESFGDNSQALAWFDVERSNLLAAVQQAHASGFDTRAWQLAWTLTSLFDRRGYWREYDSAQRTALASALRLNDRRLQAYSHRCLGHVANKLRRFDEATAQLNAARDLYRSVGDHVGLATTEADFGVMQEDRGRPALMLAHFKLALELYRTADDRAGEARALNAVGWAHALLGEYEDALDHCRRALALLEKLGQSGHVAHTLHSMGYAHQHLGHHELAVDCYRRAIRIFRDLGETYYTAFALDHLGDTHHAAGDEAAARKAWRAALVIFDDLAHPDADRIRTKL